MEKVKKTEKICKKKNFKIILAKSWKIWYANRRGR